PPRAGGRRTLGRNKRRSARQGGSRTKREAQPMEFTPVHFDGGISEADGAMAPRRLSYPRQDPAPRPPARAGVARDGFAEVVNLLGLITGSLGKIALFPDQQRRQVCGLGGNSTTLRMSPTSARHPLMSPHNPSPRSTTPLVR